MAPKQADLQNPYGRVTIRRREVGKLADHDRLPGRWSDGSYAKYSSLELIARATTMFKPHPDLLWIRSCYLRSDANLFCWTWLIFSQVSPRIWLNCWLEFWMESKSVDEIRAIDLENWVHAFCLWFMNPIKWDDIVSWVGFFLFFIIT
jgi:hypothetical protein